MEANVVYPVVIEEDDDDKNYPFLVRIPDFEGMTQGASLADAMFMASDYIALAAVDRQDDGRELPMATALDDIEIKQGETKSLVAADLLAYRAKEERRTVRTTVTIPSWLSVAARKEHINFSATLTEALEEKLGISTL